MSKYKFDRYRKRRGRMINHLISRDGITCQICGEDLQRNIAEQNHPQYVTFDHKVPRSHGGLSKLENLRLAHQACNNLRGTDPIAEHDL